MVKPEKIKSLLEKLRTTLTISFETPRGVLCAVKDLSKPALDDEKEPRRAFRSVMINMVDERRFYELIIVSKGTKLSLLLETSRIKEVVKQLMQGNIPPVDEVFALYFKKHSYGFENEKRHLAKEIVPLFLTIALTQASFETLPLLTASRYYFRS